MISTGIIESRQQDLKVEIKETTLVNQPEAHGSLPVSDAILDKNISPYQR
jgi:hypothetical protein